MHKKLMAIGLALVLCLSLAACSRSPEDETVEDEVSAVDEVENNDAIEGTEDDEEQSATPAKRFIDDLSQLFEENNIAIFPATVGSGWDQDTRCTTVIINKNVQVWLFSMEQNSEITEISVIGDYSKDVEDWEYFALSLGATAGAVISLVDIDKTMPEGTQFYASLMSELSDSEIAYIEKTDNGIEYMLDNFGDQFSLGFRVS